MKFLSMPGVNLVTLIILGYLLMNLEGLCANQSGMGFPGDGVIPLGWSDSLGME